MDSATPLGPEPHRVAPNPTAIGGSRLKVLRERFEFDADASGIGYFFCDLPFDKLVWDSRVKEHFWLPADAEVDIALFYRRIHAEDREATRRAIEASIANRTRYDVEYRTVSPQGQIKWIRAIGRTAYSPEGQPVHFDGITQDITERKRTADELHQTQERIRFALTSLPILLYTTDRELRYTWIHNTHQAYPPQRLLGKRDIDIEPERFQEVHRFKRSVLESGVAGRQEIRHFIDGKHEVYDYFAEPLRDAAGDVVGLTVVALEITHMRMAEEALRKAEKLAVVGRLAASIAHEINNPLESVMNALYLMRDCPDPDELTDLVQMAEEELARVSHIVTHSLRFNRQSTAPTYAELSEIANSALALYWGRIRNSSVSLIRDYRAAEPLLCFEGELRQVFANLIGNALDATREGSIRIRIRESRDVCTGEPGVRVTVADTGSGIEERMRGRLFEPFATSKENTGTGLGLWVSAEILKRHYATVRVRSSSRPGCSGTVFSINFPRRQTGPAHNFAF